MPAPSLSKGKKATLVQADGVDRSDATISSSPINIIQNDVNISQQEEQQQQPKNITLSGSATSNATVCKQRLIVCMDGTWNAASGNKYSNDNIIS